MLWREMRGNVRQGCGTVSGIGRLGMVRMSTVNEKDYPRPSSPSCELVELTRWRKDLLRSAPGKWHLLASHSAFVI